LIEGGKDKAPDFKDEEIKEIGSLNPIEDFKKMVSDRQVDWVSTAISQMTNIIKMFVRRSLNGNLYEKAFECLKQMRETCVKEDEAVSFNLFLREIRKEFSSGQHQQFF